MKLDINTIITQAYHISRCSSWKLSSKARIAWAFIILLRIQQGEKQKRCHPTLTSCAFLNQKYNKQTSYEQQKTLDSSCISFCTSSAKRQLKTSQVDTKLCQSKQVAICCINFLHELICQIFTNHSIKIGREARAWPTSDYGEKSEKHLSSLLAF